MITIEDVKNAFDYSYAIKRIIGFLKEYLEVNNAKGYVVGLSGGVDSSTAVTLAVKAVDSDSVIGIIMPDKTSTPPEDIKDAVKLARDLGIKYFEIEISGFIKNYMKIPFFIENKIALGNLKARIRMTLLYYLANTRNYLVLGTGDKSEILLGYFTKYGDGGVDLLPIGDLYKTQVRVLAQRLGLPENIALKPSSPRLWPGQIAEKELGIKYEEIDVILYSYFDLRLKPNEIPQKTGISQEKVYMVLERVRKTEHKRSTPPIVRVSSRSIGHDIRLPLNT